LQASRQPYQRGAISIFLSPLADWLGNRRPAERIARERPFPSFFLLGRIPVGKRRLAESLVREVPFPSFFLLGRIAWGIASWQSASPQRGHFHLSFSLGGFCGKRKLAESLTREALFPSFFLLGQIAWGTGSWQSASPQKGHFHLSFSLGGFCGKGKLAESLTREAPFPSVFLLGRMAWEPQAGRARHHREAISIFRSFPTYAMPVQARLGPKTLLKFFRRPHCQRDACTLHPQHPAGTHPVTRYIVL
jgi:hypothetical protein